MKGKIQLAHLDDTELSDATKQLSSEPPMALYVNQFITLKKKCKRTKHVHVAFFFSFPQFS